MDRDLRNFIRMSSNLIARETGALQHAPAFLREPSKHIELRYRGQAIFVVPSLIPGAIRCTTERTLPEDRAAQNIKDRPARKALEPLGLTGD